MNIILIDKEGILNNQKIKEFKEENLFKKCGFKNDNNFSMIHCWKLTTCGDIACIKLFAKNKGKSTYENKYDFPHPVNTLLFGNSILVGYSCDNIAMPLSIPIWEDAIIEINKGFDNLDKLAEEDENEEDELALVSSDKLTKDGYLKDGFIVDSDTDNNDNDEDEIDLINELQQGEIEEEEYQY